MTGPGGVDPVLGEIRVSVRQLVVRVALAKLAAGLNQEGRQTTDLAGERRLAVEALRAMKAIVAREVDARLRVTSAGERRRCFAGGIGGCSRAQDDRVR